MIKHIDDKHLTDEQLTTKPKSLDPDLHPYTKNFFSFWENNNNTQEEKREKGEYKSDLEKFLCGINKLEF